MNLLSIIPTYHFEQSCTVSSLYKYIYIQSIIRFRCDFSIKNHVCSFRILCRTLKIDL